MSPRRLALATALALLAVAAAVASLSAFAPGDGIARLSVASLWLELALALLALAGAALSRRPLRERLGLAAGRLPAGELALLVVGTAGMSQGVDGVLELTGLREQSSLAELESVLAGARGPALALAFLGIGLAPGVAEELLCRGLVQRGLEPLLGTARAVAVAALVFGVLHLDPLHAAGAACLGLYLGATAALADSVRAPVLCHTVNNLLAVAAGAYLPPGALIGPTGSAVGFALAGACLWRVWRRAGAAARAAPGLQPGRGSDDP
jgi:membrane protease YdiL (CAAX protease family)